MAHRHMYWTPSCISLENGAIDHTVFKQKGSYSWKKIANILIFFNKEYEKDSQ